MADARGGATMSRSVVRSVCWYRLRSTFGRRWSGYLAIVLLLGLVGGLALGALAGARRTQSSFPKFLRSTNPSDLLVYHDDSATDSNASDPAFLRAVARLPHVRAVVSASAPSELILGPNGFPAPDAAHRLFDSSVTLLGSDGLLFDQDRLRVTQGRMLDPDRADEMVMSSDAAEVLHIRVGDVVPIGIYTNAQTDLPTYGSAKQTPVERVGIKVVGIVAFNFELVRDDFDRSLKLALLSPALTRPLRQCCENGVFSGLQLEHGSRDNTAVEAEVKQLPKSTTLVVTAMDAASAERAIAPESIALGVFGLVALFAALVIVGQAIGRQLRIDVDGLRILRALGAGPVTTFLDALVGVLVAVVVGGLLAVVVAVVLSPFAPFGPARAVYPGGGIAFDWTVLGFGVLTLVVMLGAFAAIVAYLQAPHRAARDPQRATRRLSRLATAAAGSGLPVSAAVGIRLAVEPGRDARAVPVRSAMTGAILAMVVIVATVVFGSSLNVLVSRPALYGWNWNYELLGPYGGFADVPQPHTGQLLDRDAAVSAWASVSFDDLRIDGQNVPVLGTTPGATVGPPVLAGHRLDASDQVVLGPTTLASLHKHVGDTVELQAGGTSSTRLTVVGTATLPAIGVANNLHLEIGTGAVISAQLIPAADRGFGDLPTSPEAMLVRFRAGTNPAADYRSLVTIAHEENVLGHGPLSVVAVQRPAEIVNYRTMGNTPLVLGTALALGALVALGLTLLAAVRRRRRDLALFKTLGFSRRQLAATIAWQASVAVMVGVVVGVPIGIVVGRVLWDEFARALHVVPEPTVPAVTIALIALGAIVLGNVVAAIPGRQAARTKTAVLLRSE